MLNVKTASSDREKTLVDFSAGRLSRQAAMRMLDVDYSQLLNMLRDKRLPIPELSDAEASEAASKMVAFLNEMGV